MPMLPDHVLHYDVLTRLPVKSLVRFKSVCKYWYNLINSSTFVNICRKYTIESRDYYPTDDDLLIVNKGSWSRKDNCDEYLTYLYGPQFCRGITIIGFDDKSSDDSSVSWWRIIDASCNGVTWASTCLPGGGTLLCNPLTRASYNIHLPRDYFDYPRTRCLSGFGYDSVSDDYKIIQLVWFWDEDDIPLGSVAQIYSLRNNSWKEGNKIPSSITNLRRMDTCEVNNALHYICTENDTYLSIFAIDLHTEKFKCMALPTKLMKEDAKECKLIASNGHLYFSMRNFTSVQHHETTIWVMKEHGVIGSWTKLCELEGDIVQQSTIISYNLSKDGGEVLLIKPIDEQSGELMCYNLVDMSFRKVDVPGKTKYYDNEWVCMKASLAPILGSTTAMTRAKE